MLLNLGLNSLQLKGSVFLHVSHFLVQFCLGLDIESNNIAQGHMTSSTQPTCFFISSSLQSARSRTACRRVASKRTT